MSQSHLHQIIHSSRATAEYARLVDTLSDRNKQLHRAERETRQYRLWLHLALLACLVFIVAAIAGGAK